MMSLRARLLLGYGYLVLLIVLTAGGAAVGFFELSKGIGMVVENNFRSVNAASQMLGALGRQNNATLRILVHPDADDAARKDLGLADDDFLKAFELAAGNATAAGEAEQIAQVTHSWQTYRAAREAFVGEHHANPVDAYAEHVFPQERVLRAQLFELLRLNQEAIAAAEEEARWTAGQSGVGLGLVVALAIGSLIGLSRALQKDVLARLADFQEVSEAIAAGNLRRRLRPGQDDELGLLARRFNQAVDAQEHLRLVAQGRLAEQRQLLLGMLAQGDTPAALLALDGALVASVMPDDVQILLYDHLDWVSTGGGALRREFRPGHPHPTHHIDIADRGTLHFTLLVANHTRPVGWLVRYAVTPP